MDIAEREAFFARGGGSTAPARPSPDDAPRAHAQRRRRLGPEPRSADVRDRLARQRGRVRVPRPASGARRRARRFGSPQPPRGPERCRRAPRRRFPPRPPHARRVGRLPGLVFDEEQRPRPRAGCGIHGAPRRAPREPPAQAPVRRRAPAADGRRQRGSRWRRARTTAPTSRRWAWKRHPRHARRPTRRRRRKRASRSGTTTDRSAPRARAVPPGTADGPSWGPPASGHGAEGADGSSSSPTPTPGASAAPRRGPSTPSVSAEGVVGGAAQGELPARSRRAGGGERGAEGDGSAGRQRATPRTSATPRGITVGQGRRRRARARRRRRTPRRPRGCGGSRGA